jgi:hypothetical protein
LEEVVREILGMAAVASDTALATLSWWYSLELRLSVDEQREMTDLEAII